MQRLANYLIGIEQGSLVLFADFEDDGPMWRGTGPRESRHIVRFGESFRRAPVVHPALDMWDFQTGTNLRADIRAEQISRQGFDLVFRTWGDTSVARVRASWLAIGELYNEDDWPFMGHYS